MELEAARAFVPWWVLPAAVASHAAAAYAGAFALGALLLRLARREHARDVPWPLRARALYPLRVAMGVATWALPLSVLVALPMARGPLLGGNGLLALATAAAALLGVLPWRRRLVRLLFGGGWTLRRAFAAAATRALVLYPHLWTAIAVGIAMPSRVGALSAALFAAGIAALVWLHRGGGFRVARALGLAPEAPGGIVRAVEASASRAGVALRGVHEIELPEANAYALPHAGRMAFTRAALHKVDVRGLLAIAEHELTHLAEPARARRTRAVAVLVLAPVLALKPLLAAGGLVAVLLAVLLALLVVKLLHRRLADLETRADAGAKEAEAEAGVYARALADLYRVNLVPVVLKGTTHPYLYDRLVALGSPPPYPRPPPPSRAASLRLVALVTVTAVVLGAWGSVAGAFLRGPSLAAMALDGGDARTAAGLASARHAEGRYDDAASLYGAAAELEPYQSHWPAYASMSYAAAGRLDDAERALAEAERRGADPELAADARERIARRR